MKKCLVLIAVALFVLAIPVMAAKVTTQTYTHSATVWQAYGVSETEGATPFLGYAPAGGSGLGYVGLNAGTITAVPGVLQLVPGTAVNSNGASVNWSNFIPAAALRYGAWIKNVYLNKIPGPASQCGTDADGNPIFPSATINQHGTPAIRLWWPAMYELPGTLWQLTVNYGTTGAYADPANPGNAGWDHTEIWNFTVGVDIQHLAYELALFHEIAEGTNEVGLISYDEPTGVDPESYLFLQGLLTQAAADLQLNTVDGNSAAGVLLGEFDMNVGDDCISVSPFKPNPFGPGTGIINNEYYPACCKLLVDVGVVGANTGAYLSAK